MIMNNEKPRITVSLGNNIAISSIARDLELDPQQIKAEIESAIREHYFHFASKPVTLEYEPLKGYMLKATSSVGSLSTPSFILDLAPKIPLMTIGKALGLAQESGINLLNINNKSLTKNAISEQSDYSSVDFIGFSLVDSIFTVRHNGFARKFEEVLYVSSKPRGDIAFQDTIASGLSNHTPVVKDIETSLDIYPNQILKAALNLCVINSTSNELIELARMLLESLQEVQLVPVEQLIVDDIFTKFTVPRPDYDMALAFSKALIEGRLISEESSTVFTPSFSLDMDKVFESYCTTQIKNLILPERFEVLAQPQFPHDMTPDIADKKIIPDIVIKDKRTNEIVIVDLKNKYSQLRDEGSFKVSNDDLYQLTYYAKALKAKCCFLVYPGANPKIQYPLKSSESPEAYEVKKKAKLEEINQKNRVLVFQDQPITLYSYNVNLLGSLQDTRRSVASLCQLLIDI
jgi:5-methylcytosine-specific restriction endonuclease McrBC regulatory subunit McrC